MRGGNGESDAAVRSERHAHGLVRRCAGPLSEQKQLSTRKRGFERPQVLELQREGEPMNTQPTARAATALCATPALLVLAVLAGCATAPPNPLGLPASLQGRAELVKLDDPAYEQAVPWNALKAPGTGGVLGVAVVRLSEDVPVYRLWNGPGSAPAGGNTNRLGGWWSTDMPTGPVAQYRRDYEVCASWNQLTWRASCMLRRGSVVAVGPGQSVSAQTCGDANGLESYPANRVLWQVYVDKPWARPQELVCPPEAQDIEVDPNDVSKPKVAAAAMN